MNLAIRGNKTRYREVIEILEMLGGKNGTHLKGNDARMNYYIDEENCICTTLFKGLKYHCFTLEEFLEKFPYKVGDRVSPKGIQGYVGTILDMRWLNSMDSIEYGLNWDHTNKNHKPILYYYPTALQPYKEQELMKDEKNEDIYEFHNFTGKILNLTDGAKYPRSVIYAELEKAGLQIITEEPIKIDIPEGYEFVGVNNKQVVFEKIDCQYPKTYEECCGILQLESKFLLSELTITEEITIKQFIQLKRDH